MAHWQPTATLETLRYRAKILAQIRQFFEVRDVLEVDVPVLSETGVTDLHIDCLQTQVGGAIQYLQSSPEYFMKRLLASGSGSIYSLGKAFRDGELGRRHHPEFTMLEWYRAGWDECQLIEEVTLLLQELGLDCDAQTLMYGDIFEQVIGLNPMLCLLPSSNKKPVVLLMMIFQMKAAVLASILFSVCQWSHNCLMVWFLSAITLRVRRH